MSSYYHKLWISSERSLHRCHTNLTVHRDHPKTPTLKAEMENKSDTNLLCRLGIAIDLSLTMWEEYVETLKEQPTYETIMLNDLQNPDNKPKALLHLLETLPTRHAALVLSYSDSKTTFIELPRPCTNLLSELRSNKSNVELASWFNRTLPAKRLMSSISHFERDIKIAEDGRSQELRRLKAVHYGLTKVVDEGSVVGVKAVGKLLDAMEEIGVSLEDSGEFDELEDGADADEVDQKILQRLACSAS